MAEALGTSISNVSTRIKRLFSKVSRRDYDCTFSKKSRNGDSTSSKKNIKGNLVFSKDAIKYIKIEGTDQPVKFYPFSVFNHVSVLKKHYWWLIIFNKHTMISSIVKKNRYT